MIDITLTRLPELTHVVRDAFGRPMVYIAKGRGMTAAGASPAEAVGLLMLRLSRCPNSGVAVLTTGGTYDPE